MLQATLKLEPRSEARDTALVSYADAKRLFAETYASVRRSVEDAAHE